MAFAGYIEQLTRSIAIEAGEFADHFGRRTITKKTSTSPRSASNKPLHPEGASGRCLVPWHESTLPLAGTACQTLNFPFSTITFPDLMVQFTLPGNLNPSNGDHPHFA